jgi:predicted dehydrogenase
MKTAVIGLGRMGRRHLENVRALGLELVGLCDARSDALAAAAQEAGLEEGTAAQICFKDPGTLLREAKPQCVIIATTAPSHAELTCSAAAAGARFILCEKPMAISLAQCDQMNETCARHGARLAINHPMRYMDRLLEVKALLQSPDAGELDSLVTVGANSGVAMNGSHRFEAFHYLTGETPQFVTAWFSPDKLPNPRGPEFEDRAGTVHVTTPKGKRLILDIGANQGHGLLSIYSCRYGQVIVDEIEGTISWNFRQAEYRDRPTAQYLNPSQRGSRQIQAAQATLPSRATLQALLNNGDYPDGTAGRWTVATLVAAYESHDRGHLPVPVDDRLPKERTFPWP